VPIWFLSADDLLLGAATAASSLRVFRHPLVFRELLRRPQNEILNEINRRE